MNSQLPLGPVNAPYPADSAHSGQEAREQNFPPVRLLSWVDREIPALMLLSIAGTHKYAFDYTGFMVEKGGNAVTGHLVQRETGRQYSVQVTPMQPGEPSPMAERLAHLSLDQAHFVAELLQLIADAGQFIGGFPDSEITEGVAELLARMRRVLPLEIPS